MLRAHGHLIDQLISVVRIDRDGLILQDFCEAAAPCKSLDLTVGSYPAVPLNIGALSPVAGSLVHRNLVGMDVLVPDVECVSSLSLLSQLTSLSITSFDFGDEEPWIHLVELTKLKQLSFLVAASGDPSPLTALTGLSSLKLLSYPVVDGALPLPSTFSSLQPLSTLQELKELVLRIEACNATSLHGLAGLSRLETLKLRGPMLRSLEGVSTGLTSLVIDEAAQLESLAGIEGCQGLQNLSVCVSGVTSLHPLAGLCKVKVLYIDGTFTSLAGLEGNLCTSLHSLILESCKQLRDLSGIEGLTALQRLVISSCGVTSLQPVGQLVGGLEKLHVIECRMVQEEVLELPHIQPTADVRVEYSNVKELVLAGVVRRLV